MLVAIPLACSTWFTGVMSSTGPSNTQTGRPSASCWRTMNTGRPPLALACILTVATVRPLTRASDPPPAFSASSQLLLTQSFAITGSTSTAGFIIRGATSLAPRTGNTCGVPYARDIITKSWARMAPESEALRSNPPRKAGVTRLVASCAVGWVRVGCSENQTPRPTTAAAAAVSPPGSRRRAARGATCGMAGRRMLRGDAIASSIDARARTSPTSA